MWSVHDPTGKRIGRGTSLRARYVAEKKLYKCRPAEATHCVTVAAR